MPTTSTTTSTAKTSTSTLLAALGPPGCSGTLARGPQRCPPAWLFRGWHRGPPSRQIPHGA
eukprot:6265192-Pyramimonas_sp.AAC.1